jgi:hypothetical protein
MLKAILPLVVALATGSAYACPGDSKAMDAKVDTTPSVTASVTDRTKETKDTKAIVDKKALKPAEVKKAGSS